MQLTRADDGVSCSVLLLNSPEPVLVVDGTLVGPYVSLHEVHYHQHSVTVPVLGWEGGG